MKKYLTGRFSFRTDIGKVRLSNEDQAFALTNAAGHVLLLVCDGMGGQNKGDLASSLALNTVVTAFKNTRYFFHNFIARLWVSSVIKEANKCIYEQAQSNEVYKGMGTTMTMVLLVNGTAILGHVGDSRCYLLKNHHDLVQVSEDHTYVGYLLRTGQISPEEALTHPKRHVLMNALGVYPSASYQIKSFIYDNEPILICSDGLINNVPLVDITSILRGDDMIEQKVNELIAISNANGGTDNVAVVLWEAQT